MKRIVLFASFLFLLVACSKDDVNDANDVVPDLKGFCPDNNHPHAIDMGEAGVWACCNVGANSPEEYGGYYAWGETAEKSDYSWDTYKYIDDNSNYVYGKDIGGNSAYDVATTQWGGSWRMPTRARFEALRSNCTHEWTQVNDVYGMMFTASNGNRIFFPAAGGRYGSSLNGGGSYGLYWSSSLYEYNPKYAYGLYSYSGGVNVSGYGSDCCIGRSVRPVRP